MADPISAPTLNGFIAWAQSVMGISTIVMSPTDPGWNFAYTVALDMVPDILNSASPDIYTFTVYNWAGSQLLQYQQDIAGQSFFANARKAYGISNFTAGVISNASDVSTSEGLSIGQGLQNLQLIDLQRIKDPYGRQALAYMQSIGTMWGIT